MLQNESSILHNQITGIVQHKNPGQRVTSQLLKILRLSSAFSHMRFMSVLTWPSSPY